MLSPAAGLRARREGATQTRGEMHELLPSMLHPVLHCVKTILCYISFKLYWPPGRVHGSARRLLLVHGTFFFLHCGTQPFSRHFGPTLETLCFVPFDSRNLIPRRARISGRNNRLAPCSAERMTSDLAAF